MKHIYRIGVILAVLTSCLCTANAMQITQSSNIEIQRSVAENTKITMHDESTKDVSKLVAGDKIKAYNTQTQKFVTRTVLSNKKAIFTRLVRTKLVNGIELLHTNDCPFYTYNGWMAVSPEQTMVNADYKNVRQAAINEDVLNYDIVGTDLSEIEFIQGISEVTTCYSLILDGNEAYIANGFIIGQ